MPTPADVSSDLLTAVRALTAALGPQVVMADLHVEIVDRATQVFRCEIAALVRQTEHGLHVEARSGPAEMGRQLVDRVADRLGEVRGGEVWSLPLECGSVVLAVSVAIDAEHDGVLVLAPHLEVPVDEELRGLICAFAAHCSTVVERAGRLHETAEAAVRADRDRIAAELHDVVVQRLWLIGRRLQGARTAEDDHARSVLGEAVRDLDLSARDIRSIIFHLERDVSPSLPAAVSAMVREFEPALGFTAQVRTEGPLATLVGDDLAEQALVALRESLTNCARHAAGATSCLVEVRVAEGWLDLRVTDDGRGPGPELHESGLRNLRRRAAALGGDCRLREADGGGAVVEWRAPLDQQ